ncbi:hypothetical protein BEN48_14455 [Hymenobacter glacialis]|uniref:YD repeat-containing protein n=1 Tax=Hymenobacter glacialis TaxID=1908236 RepID=A0A1G1T3C3_9BACT|nr:hypothetical protein BEN48_14455 [Hymenobacter glacialis]
MALSNSAQGQPYGYDFVTVLEGANGENGKTEYTYTNVEDVTPLGPPDDNGQIQPVSFFVPVPNKINITNGRLLKETVYKKNKTTNAFDKVIETENVYASGYETGNTLKTIKGCIVSSDFYCGPVPYTVPKIMRLGTQYYDIDCHWVRLVSSTKRVYNQYSPAIYTQTATNYNYGNPVHRQVTAVTQQLPNGDVLREYKSYPSDYTLLFSGPVFDMANRLRLLAQPVESYTTLMRNSVEWLTGAKLITYGYAMNGNALVRPIQTDQLRLRDPINLANSGFIPAQRASQKDSRYAPVQYLGYHMASGNVDLSRKAHDITESYQWDHRYQQQVAQFVNADRTVVSGLPAYLGNEASYLGFESGQSVDANPQEDYWFNTGTGDSRNYLTGNAHTGQYAWRVGPISAWSYNYGPTKHIAPSRQAARYKLSAWVNTEPGFRAGGGNLILSVNDHNGNQVNTASSYVGASFGDTQGKWKYVEAIIDLDAVRQQAGAAAGDRYRLVAYVCNTGGSSGNPVGFRVDDLRLHPVDAHAITYTYDAATNQPTSVSDVNSRPVYYEYDALQRLVVVRDDQRNIVKLYHYNYKQ